MCLSCTFKTSEGYLKEDFKVLKKSLREGELKLEKMDKKLKNVVEDRKLEPDGCTNARKEPKILENYY